MLITKKYDKNYQTSAMIIPFTDRLEINVELPKEVEAIVKYTINEGLFKGLLDDIYSLNVLVSDRLLHVILVGLGSDNDINNRKVFMSFAKAFKKCKELKVKDITVLMDNAKSITHDKDICRKICELPKLVYYSFDIYKSSPEKEKLEKVEIDCSLEGFDEILEEAIICADSTVLARNLTNDRSMHMTPSQLAREAIKVGEETGIEVTILDESDIEKLSMGAFLAVGKGAKEEPKLIIMKYFGGDADQEIIGLIGKGIMYDSGGYSLKGSDSMKNMFDDMGGAAAVIGAIRSAAKMKLKANVIAIIAACENKVSADAYVPGDILTSMSGKTIEVLSTDAEGRLTLADAITYAIREQKVDRIIDIATLTGAARGAVGNKTAPVVSNDDDFYDVIKEAAFISCEKVWKLDADEELRSAISSAVADIKNSASDNPVGGGVITAALFIKEFVENKPWIHIDMAPVNMVKEAISYCPKGATGYGASLLYYTIKLISLKYQKH